MRAQVTLALAAGVLIVAACESSPKKSEAEDKPKVEVKVVEVGVPEEEVQKRVTEVFNRGLSHGQGIGVASLLVTTRNFEPVWESTLQLLPRMPSLVPYLLGFLDAARDQDPPPGVTEGRRTARVYAPRLVLTRPDVRELVKDRCILVLVKLVSLTRNTELAETLIPSALRQNLRREMKRELNLGARGERLENINRILSLIKSPESIGDELDSFDRAIKTQNWELATAILSSLKGTRDPRLRSACFEAMKTLYGNSLQPQLTADLLRITADLGVDEELLGFARPAVGGGQTKALRRAGIYALGRFKDADPELSKKAVTSLAGLLESGFEADVQLAALVEIQAFPAELAAPALERVATAFESRTVAPEVTEALREARKRFAGDE